MMGHVIHQWTYLVVVLNREYFYKKYTVDIPYLLKPGDMIYRCRYEGRGMWFRGKIEDVNDEGILLLNYAGTIPELVFLPFEHEPEKYFTKPEERQLIFCPLPPFRTKPNFANLATLKEMPFAKHPWDSDADCLEDYISNLGNIGVPQQLSMFG